MISKIGRFRGNRVSLDNKTVTVRGRVPILVGMTALLALVSNEFPGKIDTARSLRVWLCVRW